MADETFRNFLIRRERELTAKIAALRGQLSPLEAELAQIQDARDRNRLQASNLLIHPNILELDNVFDPEREPQGRFAEMTIKELIVQALIDAFPQGATSTALRAFIRDGYARTVEAGSLRSQLHRMKLSGILGQEPSDDTWNFRDGKRQLYARYDHPTSRKVMKELQDDPDDGGLLRAPEKLAWREEPEKGS